MRFPRSSARPIHLLFAFLLLLSPMALGCNGGQADANAKNGEDAEDEEKEEAVPVEVARLATGAMEAVVRATSNLEAEESVAIYSEAARRVQQILVEEGDAVNKGQVLLRLQDAEQRSALAKAQTLLEQAATELERQEKLNARQLTTERALNDARYDHDQKKLAVQDAERELSYATVRAPFTGTITRRLVNVGDQVQVNTHLYDLVDFDSLVARVYIPEKNLRELKVGQVARVVAAAVSDQPYLGKIDRISPVVDPRSGTVKVTVAVGGQKGLRPGMYVDVGLVTAQKDDALLIPKRALTYDNDQIFLYRLTDEQTVERVLVVPKLASRDFVEPMDGFSVGDEVVIAGQAGLKDGAKIEVAGSGLPETIQ